MRETVPVCQQIYQAVLLDYSFLNFQVGYQYQIEVGTESGIQPTFHGWILDIEEVPR